MSWRLDRLPARVRAGAYSTAVVVLLYLTLAPSKALPPEPGADKAEHAIAWFILTGLGLAFWPGRPARVAAFALFLGVLVEVLQAAMPFGRNGDLRDLVGDGAGLLAALLAWAVLRRVAGRRPLQAS